MSRRADRRLCLLTERDGRILHEETEWKRAAWVIDIDWAAVASIHIPGGRRLVFYGVALWHCDKSPAPLFVLRR